jgi:hypothetical protein
MHKQPTCAWREFQQCTAGMRRLVNFLPWTVVRTRDSRVGDNHALTPLVANPAMIGGSQVLWEFMAPVVRHRLLPLSWLRPGFSVGTEHVKRAAPTMFWHVASM